MARRCYQCGVESPWEEAFHKWKAKYLCPPCWETATAREEIFLQICVLAAIFIASVVVPLLLPLLLPAGGHPFVPSHAVFFFCVVLFGILHIIWHEAAHAVCAALLGLRVFKIEFGYRWLIGRIRVKGVFLEFKCLPFGGLTWLGSPSKDYLRLKYFLATLAAPLFDAALLAGYWWLSGHRLEDGLSGDEWSAAVNALALVLLLALVVGLLPIPATSTAFANVGNDGRLLRTIPFWTQEQVQEARAWYFIQEAQCASEDKHFARAVEWCEQGLKLYPQNRQLHQQMGTCCIFTREYIRARGHLKTALEGEATAKESKMLLLNNMAVADLLMDDAPVTDQQDEFFMKGVIDDPLAEADRFSEEVFQTIPWVMDCQEVRGCVLIALGRYAEGRPLVERAMNALPAPLDKAFCACFLALAEAEEGKLEQSKLYWETARKLDPDCLAMPKIAKQLPFPG